MLAVDDPHVAAAVRYVRDNIHETFDVGQLVQLLPISRRWLERRLRLVFERVVGVTPAEYRRVQLASRDQGPPETVET